MSLKVGTWFFRESEKKFIDWMVPKVPLWIKSNHLVMMTLVWSLLAVISGFLAKTDLSYLLIMNVSLIGQYITDCLDGAVGRYRKEGLVKWGFYMDHFLDFIFLSSTVMAYWQITPFDHRYILLAVMMVGGAFFMNSVLYFGATGEFEMAAMGIGPTEIRLMMVVINTMLAVWAKIIFIPLLYGLFVVNLVALVMSVINSQGRLWKMDMERKNKEND